MIFDNLVKQLTLDIKKKAALTMCLQYDNEDEESDKDSMQTDEDEDMGNEHTSPRKSQIMRMRRATMLIDGNKALHLANKLDSVMENTN